MPCVPRGMVPGLEPPKIWELNLAMWVSQIFAVFTGKATWLIIDPA